MWAVREPVYLNLEHSLLCVDWHCRLLLGWRVFIGVVRHDLQRRCLFEVHPGGRFLLAVAFVVFLFPADLGHVLCVGATT